ncbi:Hpt domain-containing protein [Chitinimonas koreensis]|uniref:Hpt domain-containing protein n=1 Tax=Chitinimonas koreensis TaxID=356302 RepID=UPI000416B4AB|nr:Hpt domain-containing protein [Chitinimonas koreensis]QNM95669.1 Hpt domain-containing protein [Chitinimonas koreensis]
MAGEAAARARAMNADDVEFSLLPDVITEVQEHLPQLEQDLHRLVQYPDSAELLSSAFRHMHTIKGDFGYCRATPIMEFVHQLEGVLQSLRDRTFQCSALVAEALLQSMDQVPTMMMTLARTRQFDETPRGGQLRLIQLLAQAGNQAEADQAARHVLLAAHGEGLGAFELEPPPEPPPAAASVARALALGERLAAALAERRPDWHDRVAQQRALVLALNRHYPRSTDHDVLSIAVCWHDVGLLALPDELLLDFPQPGSAGWPAYAAHPERAAAWLLAVAPDCTEAARIVRQHHLGVNGKGIAAPDHPLPPHQGALMLACADLFHERVAGLTGEDYRRGVLRTLFDIGGGLDTRFDAMLINAFDAIARDLAASAG